VIRICRTSTAVLLAAIIAAPTTALAAEGAAPPRSGVGSGGLTYNGRPLANGAALAADRSSDEALSTTSTPPASAAGQWGFGRRRHRNDGAMTAILLGATGVIAGTAVLVYANRPECSVSPSSGGCGYGAKVLGGAVTSAGVAALLIGVATWR
jgi:hypothetical protein